MDIRRKKDKTILFFFLPTFQAPGMKTTFKWFFPFWLYLFFGLPWQLWSMKSLHISYNYFSLSDISFYLDTNSFGKGAFPAQRLGTDIKKTRGGIAQVYVGLCKHPSLGWEWTEQKFAIQLGGGGRGDTAALAMDNKEGEWGVLEHASHHDLQPSQAAECCHCVHSWKALGSWWISHRQTPFMPPKSGHSVRELHRVEMPVTLTGDRRGADVGGGGRDWPWQQGTHTQPHSCCPCRDREGGHSLYSALKQRCRLRETRQEMGSCWIYARDMGEGEK